MCECMHVSCITKATLYILFTMKCTIHNTVIYKLALSHSLPLFRITPLAHKRLSSGLRSSAIPMHTLSNLFIYCALQLKCNYCIYERDVSRCQESLSKKFNNCRGCLWCVNNTFSSGFKLK